ncbi:MAG: transglutaminase domain-containing protein [Agathobacter sp.]|nr:transglutaminase domain-containing protein [Agathobacter sp.]
MELIEKCIKDKENRKKYYTIGGVALVIIAFIAAASIFLVSNFNFQVTTEAGTPFDVNAVWKKEFKAHSTVAGYINTDEVGTYKCLVKIWGLIPMNVTVEVVDTTEPKLTLQEFSINYGVECKAEDFVASCNDFSEVTYTFVTKPDTTKLGSQMVTITAADAHNNSTTQTAELIVKGVVPSYTIEGGSAFPPASVYVLDEQIEASYATEPDKSILSTVGEHPVQIQVQGIVESVTLVVVDTTAPTIQTSSIQVDKNGTISYKKSIRVTDNCDAASDIALEIDNSEVNLSTLGSYVVHCTATDLAGNTSTKDITVKVVEPSTGGHTVEDVNRYADNILASITNDTMSLREKAYAIYKWTRSNIGYVNDSPKGDWLEGAYNGMVKRRGDCFTYAATAKFLLERIGLEPLVIQKEKASWTTQNNHWWLLLNLGEGYYHFDPTRRADGTWFFMWTDAQILEYSNNHGGSHNFTRDKYPKIQ